jgi:transcriptional regulator with XRE-family HTH domain
MTSRLKGGQADATIPAIVITEGKAIALRREQLKWNQDELAERADVSRSSVWKIENGRNVLVDTLRAVEDALAAEEKIRGLRPTLSNVVSTTDPSAKEGADVVFTPAKLEALRTRLANLEAILPTVVAELGLIRLELDPAALERDRKRG